jgi:hypothetical protein
MAGSVPVYPVNIATLIYPRFELVLVDPGIDQQLMLRPIWASSW